MQLDEILNLKPEDALQELSERPPMEAGKVVKIDVEKRTYNDKEVPVMVIYILDKDTEFIRRQSIKISNRKPSKFSIFLEKLKEVGYDEPLSNLEGAIFKWEYKTIKINNFDAPMWIPVKFIDKEPVTTEELTAVEEYLQNLNNLNNNTDDLLQIR